MKSFLSRFKYLVAGILLAAAIPVTAQMIYGNTFPFWNVNGPLTVTGTTTLSGTTNITGATNFIGNSAGTAASAGYVGEILSATVAAASGTSASTTQTRGGACVALTAGDWDVYGVAQLSGTSITYSSLVAGITTNALSQTAMTTAGQSVRTIPVATAVTGGPLELATPVVPVNISTTTTYCVAATPAFGSGSGLVVYGNITARRMR